MCGFNGHDGHFLFASTFAGSTSASFTLCRMEWGGGGGGCIVGSSENSVISLVSLGQCQTEVLFTMRRPNSYPNEIGLRTLYYRC